MLGTSYKHLSKRCHCCSISFALIFYDRITNKPVWRTEVLTLSSRVEKTRKITRTSDTDIKYEMPLALQILFFSKVADVHNTFNLFSFSRKSQSWHSSPFELACNTSTSSFVVRCCAALTHRVYQLIR